MDMGMDSGPTRFHQVEQLRGRLLAEVRAVLIDEEARHAHDLIRLAQRGIEVEVVDIRRNPGIQGREALGCCDELRTERAGQADEDAQMTGRIPVERTSS